MKTINAASLIVAIVLLVPTVATAQKKYVGTKSCFMCHQTEKQGKQKDIWMKSAHAGAYKTLTTAKADEVAKAKGISGPAAGAKECLECHTTVADAKLLDKGFDIKKLRYILAARAIGGFLDESLAHIPNYSYADKFKKWISSFDV